MELENKHTIIPKKSVHQSSVDMYEKTTVSLSPAGLTYTTAVWRVPNIQHQIGISYPNTKGIAKIDFKP